MHPLSDHVLIEIYKSPKKIGLLFVPDSPSQIAISRGKVVALGDGEWLTKAEKRKPFEVEIEDDVIFSPMAGVYVDDQKTKVSVRECDILAVIGKDTVINQWNPHSVHARDIEVAL
jgi:co-chaperonin GroES (HSP10)